MAQKSKKPAKTKTEETGWLIERPGEDGPFWMCRRGWSKESTKAIRFARKIDAEDMISKMSMSREDDWTATEHIWT